MTYIKKDFANNSKALILYRKFWFFSVRKCLTLQLIGNYYWNIYICIYIIYISCLSIMNNCTIHCNFAVLTVWKMPFIWSNQMNVRTVQRRCHLQLCCRKLLWNKFWEIHRKAAVLESLFNKVAGLRPLWLYAKGDSSTLTFFQWILGILSELLYSKAPPAECFWVSLLWCI